MKTEVFGIFFHSDNDLDPSPALYTHTFYTVSDMCLKIVYGLLDLTHWGRETHICVSKLTIIGSDNSLSSGRQAIIWTNAGIL